VAGWGKVCGSRAAAGRFSKQEAARGSEPGCSRILALEVGFELGVSVGFEGGPIAGGLDAFAIGGAEPEANGNAVFTDLRVHGKREAFVEFDLQFRRIG